jgi:hypothetical protein
MIKTAECSKTINLFAEYIEYIEYLAQKYKETGPFYDLEQFLFDKLSFEEYKTGKRLHASVDFYVS